MRILLDGSHCEDLDATTIGEAIEAACERAQQLGRIVVQIAVNQRTVDAEALSDPNYIGSTASEVALTSLEPKELLLKSLELGTDAVLAANERFEDAARSIQAGEPDKATTSLQEGIELWQTIDEHVLREAVPMVQAVSTDAPPEREFKALVEQLEDALGSIKKAVRSGDLAALSDSLLYEFPETSQQWVHFFEACTKAVTSEVKDTMKEQP